MLTKQNRKRKKLSLTNVYCIAIYLVTCFTVNAEILLINHFNGDKSENYSNIQGLRLSNQKQMISSHKSCIYKDTSGNNEVLQLGNELQYVLDTPLVMRSGGIAFWINNTDGFNLESYRKHGNTPLVKMVFQNGSTIKIYFYYNNKYDEWVLNCHIVGNNQKLIPVNYRIAGSITRNFTKKLSGGTKWKGGEWHHVALTWGMNDTRLYLDGSLMDKRVADLQLNKLVSFSLGTKGASHILMDELVLFNEPDDVDAILQTVRDEHKFNIPEYNKYTTENGPAVTNQRGYYVPFINIAPLMDGNVLDDPAWQEMAQSFVLGVNDYNHSPVFPPTVWGIAHDNKYIYVSAVCFEPNMADLHYSKHGNDVWGDDAIELFFAPKDKILQFVGNAGDGYFDGKGRGGSEWNCPDWTKAAKRDNDFWSIEFKLPLNVVAEGVENGELLKFNFGRDFKAGNNMSMRYGTWSYLMGSSFFKEVRYNQIVLGKKGDDANNTAWKTANAGFADKFKKDLKHRFLDLNKTLSISNDIRNDPNVEEMLSSFDEIADKMKQINALGLSDYESIYILIDTWMGINKIESSAKETINILQKKLIEKYTINSFPDSTTKGVSENEKYFYINMNGAKYAINKSNGIISGVWNAKGEKITDLIYDSYILETKHDDAEEYFEFDDTVFNIDIKHDAGKTVLSMKCKNTNILSVILKQYTFHSDKSALLSKKVSISDVKQKEILMKIISNTCFCSSYRKNSIYNRYIANGANLTLYPANKISEDLGIPFTTGWPNDNGWSQWLLVNPDQSSLFAQYIWKVNNKVVFPPLSPIKTYLTKYGWKIPYFTQFLNPEKNSISAEICFDFYNGDRVSYYKERYFGREEIEELYSRFSVPSIVKGLRFGVSSVNFHLRWLSKHKPNLLPHEMQFWDEFMKYCRSDETGVNCNMHWAIKHPDYSAEPDKKFTAGILEHSNDKFFEIPSEFIKSSIKASHDYTKDKSKVSLYTYHAEVFSPLSAADESWYVHLKNGKRINSSWCESLCIANTTPIVESGKYLNDAEMLYKYIGMDSYYVDGYPALPLSVDWNTFRVTPPNYIVDLSLDLEKIASKYNGFNFYNSGGLLIPGQDVAYYEGADGRNSKYQWQEASDAFLLSQISRRKNVKVIPLKWQSDIMRTGNVIDSRNFINNIILFGWTSSNRIVGPTTQKKYYNNNYLATQRGAFRLGEIGVDLSEIQLVDFDMKPCWWKDWNKEIESYSYNIGNASLINFINHSESEKDITFSLNIDEAGIEKDKPVNIYLLRPVYANDFLIPFKALQKSWYIREMFSKVRIEKYELSSDRLSFKLPGIVPDAACVVLITQTPAFVYSADNINTDIPLPEQLGIKIDCVDQENDSLLLKVSADKNAHIVVPEFNVNSEVMINNTKLPASHIGTSLFSDKQVLVIPIKKGTSTISIKKSTRQSNIQYSKINIDSLPTKINAGDVVPISISYDFSETPLDEHKVISVYLYRNGICRYYNSEPIANNKGKIKIQLDTYTIPNEVKNLLNVKKEYKYSIDIAVSTEHNVFNAPVFRKRCGEIVITE